MSPHFIFKSDHPLLKPYVEDYMYISGELPFSSKKIPPRPGASLILDFDSPFYCNDTEFLTTLSGFQKNSFIYRPGTVQTDHLVVRFHPHGLSRFTDIPVHELTDQVVDPNLILGPGIDELYQRARALSSPKKRITLVERFLLSRYSPPSATDKSISRIAKMMRKNFKNVTFDLIREQAPLSTRQLERKFKEAVGVDMQTYMRICRFDYAKSLAIKESSFNLTDISFKAGYYDQPHFSHEVKHMTGVSPKHLESCMTTF